MTVNQFTHTVVELWKQQKQWTFYNIRKLWATCQIYGMLSRNPITSIHATNPCYTLCNNQFNAFTSLFLTNS